MKYSEYLQLRDLLESNGVTMDEFKKNPELYEGIIGKAAKGLWNLAKRGMKFAVSKGISSSHKKQLNDTSEKIKKWVIDEIKKGQGDTSHSLYKVFAAKKEAQSKIRPGGKTASQKQETKDAIASVKALDREISRYLNDNVNTQVRRVEKNIAKNTHIQDDDKELLEDYWDSLKYQIKIAIGIELREQNIMSEDGVEELVSALVKNAGKFGEIKTDDSEKTKTVPSTVKTKVS